MYSKTELDSNNAAQVVREYTKHAQDGNEKATANFRTANPGLLAQFDAVDAQLGPMV